MKRLIVVALTVVVLAAAGYVAFISYQRHKLVNALTPIVKAASLRAEATARYDVDKESKITFAEMFERVESDVAAIDEHLLAVRSLATEATAPTTDPVVAYLQAIQEYLRAISSKTRRILASSTANDILQSRMRSLQTSSSYGRDFATRSAEDAVEDLRKAADEYRVAISDLKIATERLRDLRRPVAEILPSDALISEAQLDAVVAENSVAEPGEPGANVEAISP